MSIALHAAAQARRLLALTAAGLPSVTRVILWITTAFHLDTPKSGLDPLAPLAVSFFHILIEKNSQNEF
jgi:hypothetical protein